MAIDAARLRILLQVEGADKAARDIDGLGQRIDRAGQTSRRASDGVESLSRATRNAGDGANRAGQQATGLTGALQGVNAKALLATAGVAGLGVGAMQAGKQVIGSAIDWETAFAGVVKTVDGTAAEMAALEDGIRQMATEMPIAAVEIAGVAEAAGQLGVAQENILEFSRVTSLLGVTTNVSADQAATALGQLSNVLGLTAEDYERFASSLVAVGNAGASTEADVLSITTRIGAAAKLIGFTTDETIGWASAVANLGLESQAAGGAIQTFALQSASLIAEGSAELEVMAETAGMTAEAFQTAFASDSSAALQSFTEGLGELDQAAQLAVLSALGFNDINITRTILGLANSADNLSDSLATSEQGWIDNNAMQVEAQKRFQTTASRIETAKNRLNDVSVEIGTVFLPAVADAAETLADLAVGLGDVVDHLTSSSTLDALDIWTAGMEQIGATDVEFPEPPEEQGRRWGHFVSDMMGHDWGSLWGAMEAPDDIMNQFAGMSLPELASPEQRAALEEIIDAYGRLRPEMGGVTEAQRDQAQELLHMVDAYEGVIEKQAEMQRQGMTGTEVMQHSTEAWRAEQAAATEAAEAWFSAAEAQGVTAQMTAEQTAARERELAVLADLESGHDAYAGSMDAVQRAQQGSDILGLQLAGTLRDLGYEFYEVASAADAMALIQGTVHQNISDAAGAISHWEGELRGTQQAIEYLNEAQERQGFLTKEQQEQLEILEWAEGRRADGIENDLIPAYVEAEVRSAEYLRTQDELNQMLEDNIITEDEHRQMLLDAALAGDDASLAAYGLAEAQSGVADAVSGVIDQVRDLLIELGLLPERTYTEVELNTQNAINAYNGFLQYLRDNPGQSDMYVNVINQMGFTENNAQGGVMPQGGWSWVGEEGKELLYIPPGGQVFNHHTSNEMAQRLPGFAQGTSGDRPDPSRMEQTALDIIGNLEVVLDPEAVAEAEAELAALWDAKRVAEELGLGDAVIAEINEQIRAKEAELRIIGEAAGTSVGQGITEQIEAELEAADLEAARAELTDSLAGLLSDMDGIISGETGTMLGEKLVEALSLQKIAEQMGDADLAAHYAEQVAAINEQLEQLGDIMATPIVEAQIQAQIAAENTGVAIEDLYRLFAHGSDLYIFQEGMSGAKGVIDDLIASAADGSVEMGELFDLMATVPGEDIMPVLEQLENTYRNQLVEAIANGNVEAEASIRELMRVLGMLQDEFEDTAKTANMLGLDVHGNPLPEGSNITQVAPGQWVSGAANNAATTVGARAMATGGIVTQPLLALVGERGPEMVQPLSANAPERAAFIRDVAAEVARTMAFTNITNVNIDGEPVGESVNKVNTKKLATNMGPI